MAVTLLLAVACRPPATGVAAVTPEDSGRPADTATPEEEKPHESAPFVIVGGGISGLAAAMDLPGSVLLEAADHLGGRAAEPGRRSFFFAGTTEQAAAGVDDSAELAVVEWEAITGVAADAATQRFLAESAAVHDRLAELGIAFQLDRAVPIGQVTPRLHEAQLEGADLTAAFPLAEVDVRLSTPAIALHVDAGAVSGVETDEAIIDAPVVILASGGFVGRADLVVEHVPYESGTWTVHSDAYAMGTALDFAAAHDLATAELGAIGTFVNAAGIPGSDGHAIPMWSGHAPPWVDVDATGQRFVDESRIESVALAAAIDQHENVWSITTRELFSAAAEPTEIEAADAGLTCAASWEDLSATLDVHAIGLSNTLAEVDRVRGGANDRFNRASDTFPDLSTGTPCAFPPGRELTKNYGGVAVSEVGEALDGGGSPVGGLYVVGEAAGMASPGMGGPWGFDGSISAVVWSGWRAAADIGLR